ncbi:MAG: PHP domain-containing protein [Ferruginibacter sp.]
MTNAQIADNFSLLAKLMDIHGENSFKSKSYAASAFAIEKLNTPLEDFPTEKIAGIKGIGSSGAQKISEMLETKELKILRELLQATPAGILEMLNIKGIGPKKINTIWKEMALESVGELLYACEENRLKIYKGFGEKTQNNIADAIRFYQKTKGSYTWAQVDGVKELIVHFMEAALPGFRLHLTGSYYRQLEIMHELEFVTEAGKDEIKNILLKQPSLVLENESENSLTYKNSTGLNIKINAAPAAQFFSVLVQTSSAPEFYNALPVCTNVPASEKDFFAQRNLAFIPAMLREKPGIINQAENGEISGWIMPSEIKGLIHCHSNWSDGSNSIEEMAEACIEKGLEYMVLSDHSKSAFYAQGLYEEKIRAQHEHIDELNAKLAPFKIFRSIESDILNDGSLDYSEDVLASFDCVIASVHSNLKMTEEKAMSRLLRAIENPFTTILGHMTGRLLLGRPAYPVDHYKIIDACAANHVVIELNANPNRLDMDWRYIDYALEKGVLISIDPDAHYITGIDDTQFGIMVAQKAFVKKQHNLSSYSLPEFEAYLQKIKTLKNI